MVSFSNSTETQVPAMRSSWSWPNLFGSQDRKDRTCAPRRFSAFKVKRREVSAAAMLTGGDGTDDAMTMAKAGPDELPAPTPSAERQEQTEPVAAAEEGMLTVRCPC